MRASTALRVCMTGLVLLNLVFVQLTDSAGLGWLLLLYALAIFSPLLIPLRENVVYRALWNSALLSVFTVLLWHATGNDMRFVLEDGLVLAALCQVHLLNNLRSEQRPDLLFLNSFLIAIVTGYLTLDLAYPIVFMAFAPLFVIGLQLLCVTREGDPIEPAATSRIVRDGILRSGVLLVATLAVFLFWPRDFYRQGYLSGFFDLSSRGDQAEVAFEDSLTLERTRSVEASDRVVLRVGLQSGSPAHVPTLWRGATLGATNGQDWWAFPEGDLASSATGDQTWTQRSLFLRRGERLTERGAVVSVSNVDPAADRLFTPLSARELVLDPDIAEDQVHPLSDATVRYGEPSLARPPVVYELVLAPLVAEAPGGPVRAELPPELARFAALPRSRKAEAAVQLAATLAGRLPAQVEQHELVARFSDHLSERFVYLPPGDEGAAGSLAEFLGGRSGGHCEFFASALATMLRSRGVPCRLVTGYRSSEWNATGDVLTLRRRDAHAWVEVHDPTLGWYPVDPSPAAPAALGPGLWERLQAAAVETWNELSGFDAERRAAVFAWLRGSPARSWGAMRENPRSAALAVVALALAGLLVGLRRRRHEIPSVRLYHRALRRCGLRLGPGETPRELLTRAADLELPPERLATLRTVTLDHERSRYAA